MPRTDELSGGEPHPSLTFAEICAHHPGKNLSAYLAAGDLR